MRLLLFSDLHADINAARRLVTQSKAADVVIGAGDFGNARRDVNACIDVLRSIAHPAILVPGNNESLEELMEACRPWPTAQVLHGSGVNIAGIQFFGIGGGVPLTPFGPWSYDFTEEQAALMLADCPAGCVLVSHSPPKGVLDNSSAGKSLGSTAVREAVLKKHPMLVVCGHIHASAGRQEMLGASPVVNAGPQGMEWQIASPGE